MNLSTYDNIIETQEGYFKKILIDGKFNVKEIIKNSGWEIKPNKGDNNGRGFEDIGVKSFLGFRFEKDGESYASIPAELRDTLMGDESSIYYYLSDKFGINVPIYSKFKAKGPKKIVRTVNQAGEVTRSVTSNELKQWTSTKIANYLYHETKNKTTLLSCLIGEITDSPNQDRNLISELENLFTSWQNTENGESLELSPEEMKSFEEVNYQGQNRESVRQEQEIIEDQILSESNEKEINALKNRLKRNIKKLNRLLDSDDPDEDYIDELEDEMRVQKRKLKNLGVDTSEFAFGQISHQSNRRRRSQKKLIRRRSQLNHGRRGSRTRTRNRKFSRTKRKNIHRRRRKSKKRLGDTNYGLGSRYEPSEFGFGFGSGSGSGSGYPMTLNRGGRRRSLKMTKKFSNARPKKGRRGRKKLSKRERRKFSIPVRVSGF